MSPLARFIAASGATNLADGVATVAWAWLASLLTRDPLWIAALPVALRLPWVLCAIPAGIVTDRVDRRHLILAMDAVRCGAFVAVGVILWRALPLAPAPTAGVTDTGVFAALIGAALCVGGAEVFRDNAAQTMLPALCPPAGLERANGRLWSVELVGNALIGPALGALLIAVAVPLPFVMNGAIYGVAVGVVWTMTGVFRPGAGGASPAPRNWRRDLRDGYAYLRDAPVLRRLAIVTGVWNLFFQMAMIALVLHVQENLSLGPVAYGVILSAGAVGGIAGGMVGHRIIDRLGPGRAAQWMLAASAPAFLGMALAPGALTLALVLAVFEFSGLVWNTVSVSYRQRAIPDALLGRVNSLHRLLAWGMMPVGLLASGLIVRGADTIGPRDTALLVPFVVAALGALGLTVLGWRGLGAGFAPKP